MPLFKCEASLFTVHGQEALKSFDAFTTREMRGALRAFLKACLPKIPVRTGFLRGAFRPLREAFLRGDQDNSNDPGPDKFLGSIFAIIGHKDVAEMIEKHNNTNSRGEMLNPAQREARIRAHERDVRRNLRIAKRRKKNPVPKDMRLKEYYYPARGNRILKTPTSGVQFLRPQAPGDVIKLKGLTAQIKLDVQISYYRVNDFYSRVKGGPWRSMDAGFQAALNYLEGAAARYPFLTEVLVAQRIYLRGTQIGKQEGNMAADYRRRFGSTIFHESSGNVRDESTIMQAGFGGSGNSGPPDYGEFPGFA